MKKNRPFIHTDISDANGGKMPKIRYCANCRAPIKQGDEYVKCLDNFLQVRFFDSNDCNIFCDNDCLAMALSVEHFRFEDNNGDDSVYENEDEEEDPLTPIDEDC